MRRLSRRELLKISAAGAAAYVAGGVLSACKGLTTSDDGGGGGALNPGTKVSSDLVVVRNGEPEPLVRAAVAALGGMGQFVPKGAKVVVKPNTCVTYRSYEYAATTNPWVVGTLVKMAFEAGASQVKVLDYPFGGLPDDAYSESGIADQVQAAGGDVVVISDQGFVATKIPQGKALTKTDVYRDVLNADVLINVPIAKHHYVTDLSLGMKNLMGIVYDRDAFHSQIHQSIADLNTLIRPALTVMDATRILTNNGPQGGELADVKKLDTIIAGADVVAVDSYAATLFGKQPRDIDYIGLAADMGLGECDLSKVKITELTA
jgi:uncharacterized protein (DUF362 family)